MMSDVVKTHHMFLCVVFPVCGVNTTNPCDSKGSASVLFGCTPEPAIGRGQQGRQEDCDSRDRAMCFKCLIMQIKCLMDQNKE